MWIDILDDKMDIVKKMYDASWLIEIMPQYE